MTASSPEEQAVLVNRKVSLSKERTKEKKMRKISALKVLRNRAAITIGALSALIFTFSSTATAQCGGSLTALAAAAASIPSQSKGSQSSVQNKSILTKDNAVNPSIVGLWHVGFFVETPNGPLMIQEAFQIWNT